MSEPRETPEDDDRCQSNVKASKTLDRAEANTSRHCHCMFVAESSKTSKADSASKLEDQNFKECIHAQQKQGIQQFFGERYSEGQGSLWQDAGTRNFQRSGRHPGCAPFRRHQSSDVPYAQS